MQTPVTWPKSEFATHYKSPPLPMTYNRAEIHPMVVPSAHVCSPVVIERGRSDPNLRDPDSLVSARLVQSAAPPLAADSEAQGESQERQHPHSMQHWQGWVTEIMRHPFPVENKESWLLYLLLKFYSETCKPEACWSSRNCTNYVKSLLETLRLGERLPNDYHYERPSVTLPNSSSAL